jgi:hypothetical protein
METITIEYLFHLPNNTKEVFNLEIDAQRLELVSKIPDPLPRWAEINFHRCPNCTLDNQAHSNCPLILNMVNIVNRFDGIISYDEITIEVKTEERIISQPTTAQRGISSLMGIVFATSGCPHTVYFKPMARFHLPLASKEETIYRASSMYLLAQYFIHRAGRKADIELTGLKKIYDDIQVVNVSIVKRLRAATETDSSVNAVILLDMYAKAIPFVIEDSLEEIRHLFTPYLKSNLLMDNSDAGEDTP